MKHLLLFRHAKSSWANLDQPDFDRPLNARGEKAAKTMARYVCDQMPLPDVILCSPARRTRQTLCALVSHYAHSLDISLQRTIYHASPEIILNEIQTFDGGDVLMVVGHNPGLEHLAHLLCRDGNHEIRHDMGTKFPTAACAHLSFTVQNWSDIAPHAGVLEQFVKPRDLAGD
jgi:phosphohistidine phosphatase